MLGFASHQHRHFAIRYACSVSAVTEARVMVRRASMVGVFTLATVVLAAPFAVAQTGSGIAGVVKDATGAVLPGVTVEASSPALLERTRTAVIDSLSLATITALRAGEE